MLLNELERKLKFNINNYILQDVTPVISGPQTGNASQGNQQSVVQQRPAHAKEYNFLDIELKYGILQVFFILLNMLVLENLFRRKQNFYIFLT